MNIDIKTYGKIKDVINDQTIEFKGLSVNDLINELKITHPQLPEMIYSIAVNNIVVDAERKLNNNDEVCLLPPFAGG